MGRALFSQTYASSPAVRTEPETTVDPYEKWSRWNAFDPDSEEFFDNAEYEAFIDPAQYRREQEDHSMGADSAAASSASSESSLSDRASPMAVGSDDPAILIADVHSSVYWEQLFRDLGFAGAEGRRARDERDAAGHPRAAPPFNPRATRTDGSDHVRPSRVNRPRSATVSAGPTSLPPSSLRNSTTATDINAEISAFPSHPPSLRRTINITPIDIPIEPSTPSPISPESPSTPPDVLYHRQAQTMFTPSPAPTVTPRIYNWNRHPIPTSPTSPSAPQGTSPLTNPNARMSLARINVAPTRVRIQNAVV